MEVREGYKQTEVGVIPEDWRILSIIDFTDGTAGGTPSTLIDIYWGGDIPWMSSGELHFKNVYDVKERITDIGLKNSSTKIIPSNCVLIGLAGQGKTRGTVAINRIPLCTNQSIAAIYPNDTYNSDYLYHYLDNQYKELRMLSTGDGGRGGLNLTIIRNIKVPIPPKPEQQAIAQALSDTDALIDSLEKLIEKKERIKQGAMQELLTGKRHLPGFSGEWKKKKLGKECEVITKGTTPTSIGRNFAHTGINFIKVESLRKNGAFIEDMFAHIDEGTHSILKRSQLQDKDLLISIAGALGRIGIVNNDILPANTNQALAIVRLKENTSIHLSYLFYYLNTNAMTKNIDLMSSQGAQPNLSLENIYNLPIKYPQDLVEQREIATILSDMDGEIEALETKLQKTREIKEGMMHELLTGRIRLI